MGNNVALQMVLKTLTPTVQKFAESGKLDGFFQTIKAEAAKNTELAEGESVEIILTTEDDGREYISIVVLAEGPTIKTVLQSMPLSDMILQLLSKI